MAAFQTLADAEVYARAKMADGTFIVAHSQRTKDGVISVRGLRPQNFSLPSGGGDWVVVTDDGA
jgi:hypothetical protein